MQLSRFVNIKQRKGANTKTGNGRIKLPQREKSFPVFKEQPWNLKFAHQTGRNGITWRYFRQISQDVTYYKINNAN